jgi:hypothetical protein
VPMSLIAGLRGVWGGASASPVLEPSPVSQELFVGCEFAREFMVHGDVCMLVSMRGSANVHSCPEGEKQKRKGKANDVCSGKRDL